VYRDRPIAPLSIVRDAAGLDRSGCRPYCGRHRCPCDRRSGGRERNTAEETQGGISIGSIDLLRCLLSLGVIALVTALGNALRPFVELTVITPAPLRYLRSPAMVDASGLLTTPEFSLSGSGKAIPPGSSAPPQFSFYTRSLPRGDARRLQGSRGQATVVRLHPRSTNL
jgi:hypothetical protein